MAASTQGVSGYLFGVDATSPTDALFQNLRRGRNDALVNFVHNESGVRITKRSDDETKTLTGEFRIKTAWADLAINATLTITGGRFAGTYIVVSTDEGQVNNDFVTYQFNAEAYESITPS